MNSRTWACLALGCLFGYIQAQLPGSGNTPIYDGIDNYASIPDNNAINDGDFTIEFWFSPSAENWAAPLLDLTEENPGATKYFFVDGTQSQLRFWFESANDADIQITASYTFKPDEWYHVACVGGFRRRADHYLYINGERVSRSTRNTNRKPTQFPNDIWLGMNHSTYIVTNGHFEGQIDELRIWDVARSQSEIREYMCKKARASDPELRRYFNFDEENGPVIYDIANGNEGLLIDFDLPDDRETSSAPVGEESVNLFGVNNTSSLAFTGPYGDRLEASVDVGTAGSIHIYRVEGSPNVTTAPGDFNYISAVNYYGVKAFDGAIEYTVEYNYEGHPFIEDENSLGLASRKNNAATEWTQTSTTLDTDLNTLTLSGQTGTEFILGTTSTTPLPIELTYFKASATESNQVLLSWETASEISNDFFTIERSRDLRQWELVSTMQGAGNSSTAISYSAIDRSPLEGTSYYRLKQTDYDGSFSYSPSRAVNILPASALIMFPNPAKDELTIQGRGLEHLQLQVYDTHGNEVTGLVKFIKASSSEIRLDISMMKSGLYIVRSGTMHWRLMVAD